MVMTLDGSDDDEIPQLGLTISVVVPQGVDHHRPDCSNSHSDDEIDNQSGWVDDRNIIFNGGDDRMDVVIEGE